MPLLFFSTCPLLVHDDCWLAAGFEAVVNSASGTWCLHKVTLTWRQNGKFMFSHLYIILNVIRNFLLEIYFAEWSVTLNYASFRALKFMFQKPTKAVFLLALIRVIKPQTCGYVRWNVKPFQPVEVSAINYAPAIIIIAAQDVRSFPWANCGRPRTSGLWLHVAIGDICWAGKALTLGLKVWSCDTPGSKYVKFIVISWLHRHLCKALWFKN